MATAQVGFTTKPPDARRNGRTQELRIRVHVQWVHRGDGSGERSVRTEADDGRHEGDGSRTTIGR